MKHAFYLFAFVLFISCDSDDEPLKDYSAENEQEIIEYIASHNLDATRTSSGLYYVIDEEGTGAEITATSDVSVIYRGTFTDGSVFDHSNEEIISFNLQQVILGFAEGMQYFREGGTGLLLIPAHLAYGSEDTPRVPAGSVLIFEIEVIDYKIENEAEIVRYLEINSIANATRSETGLYYAIDEEGVGANPIETSNITVAYKGYLTDGDIFDESTVSGTAFYLDQVIPGFSEGMQYFKEGGKGKLFIPSHLAYGRYGAGNIPGGAVLIFEVDLISIN